MVYKLYYLHRICTSTGLCMGSVDTHFYLYNHMGEQRKKLCLILASFAGWAVSLCALGAAVQTHAKLTMAGTVIRSSA